MISPFTGGTVTQFTENMKITFRKESFTVVAQFYECDDTGEEFTTTEQDELTINQAYNQYREKYGIPFIEDIIGILNKYDISALKISKILGFGDNQYLKYTKGEMPSVSNGRMIAMIQDVSEFKKILNTAQNEFTPDEFLKIEKKISPIKDSNITFIEQLISDSTFSHKEKSVYTGYIQPQVEKIKNMILFFVNQCDGVYVTKLNKFLFYSDFLCFKEIGKGMSGLTYQAIQFGPVPLRYSTVYENVGGTEAEIEVFSNGNAGTKIIGKDSFNPILFTNYEITVLERVLEKFKNHNAETISQISHNEEAWIVNEKTKSTIRYDLGFKLKAL